MSDAVTFQKKIERKHKNKKSGVAFAQCAHSQQFSTLKEG